MAVNRLATRSSIALLNSQIGELVKRAMDIIVSLIALIFLLPFFCWIVIAIRRDSPGPFLFRGRRMGKNGKPFTILKFRTMYECPSSYNGPSVTACDDARVTRVGRILRDTKLNELPQFWNVLVGEMSLVGPRPEDVEIAKTWPKDVWDEVLSVRPGVTSPATILYHDEEKILTSGNLFEKYMNELAPDKSRLDQLYVRHHSFSLDLDILFWTFLILLPLIGKSLLPSEEKLFAGPISQFIRHNLSWFTLDLVTALAVFYVTDLIWVDLFPPQMGWINALATVGVFIITLHLTGILFGLNRVRWQKAVPRDVIHLAFPWLFACLVTASLYIAFFGLRQDVILVPFILSLVGFSILRFRSRLFNSLTRWLINSSAAARATRERVLIIGTGRTAEHIAWIFEHPAYQNKFNVMGFIDDNFTSAGGRIYGSNVIGTYKQIPEILRRMGIGLVILADHTLQVDDFHDIDRACQQASARLVQIPDIFGSFLNLQGDLIPESESTLSTPDDPRCLVCMLRDTEHDDCWQPKPSNQPGSFH